MPPHIRKWFLPFSWPVVYLTYLKWDPRIHSPQSWRSEGLKMLTARQSIYSRKVDIFLQTICFGAFNCWHFTAMALSRNLTIHSEKWLFSQICKLFTDASFYHHGSTNNTLPVLALGPDVWTFYQTCKQQVIFWCCRNIYVRSLTPYCTKLLTLSIIPN